MNIASQITRIQQDRDTIRTKLVELGLASNTDNLGTLAEAMDDIINQGSVSASVKEGESYTIPKGYHSGSGTVSGISGGGNYNLQSKSNVIPSKKQQQITPDDGYFGLSDVTVAPIPDAYQNVSSVTAGAGDVLSGKIIVGKDGTSIAGTMVNNGAVNKTLTVDNNEHKIPAGYHNGSGVIKIVPEDKTTTPTKESQNVIASEGKVLRKVTVGPIPAAYQDVTQVNAEAGHILDGKKIVSATGEVVIGSMSNNGAINVTIDGLTQTSYEVPAGYTTGGTISLTSDIEDALAAI